MLDHAGLQVTDLGRSTAFYRQALAPLGYGLVESRTDAAGFGPPGRPLFWLYAGTPPRTGVPHLAFAAPDRGAVDAFHAAALAAGGRDDGVPGPRPVYHPHYYGAFVVDPDGYRIEAVCHTPPRGRA